MVARVLVDKTLIDLYRDHVAQEFSFFTKTLSDLGYSRLIISAGEVKYHFRDDNDFPFKLNPYFAKWLNLAEGAGSQLIVDVNQSKPALYYYFPEDIWHKPSAIDDAVVHQCFDVVNFSDEKEVSSIVSTGNHKTAYIGREDDYVFAAPCEINPEALLNALDYQRAYKSDYEQACIRLANEIAVKGHFAAQQGFIAGKSEYQIYMDYLQATDQLENDQPYMSIVALNENGSVLHYPKVSNKIPTQHRSFLIDAGASVGGYASDISRTYAEKGCVFADLITAMDQVQLQLVDSVQLGVSYLDLHVKAHQLIAKVLLDFELVTGHVDDLIGSGVSQVFFPHGLGHYLGIQVHDKGGWFHTAKGDEIKPPAEHPYLRLTRVIEPNQVFTIEPGLYFIDSLLQQAKSDSRSQLVNWQTVERFMPYGGIRIEDNILVREDQVLNLTRLAGLH